MLYTQKQCFVDLGAVLCDKNTAAMFEKYAFFASQSQHFSGEEPKRNKK